MSTWWFSVVERLQNPRDWRIHAIVFQLRDVHRYGEPPAWQCAAND